MLLTTSRERITLPRLEHLIPIAIAGEQYACRNIDPVLTDSQFLEFRHRLGNLFYLTPHQIYLEYS
jgi:hypothetical protein